jgi:hypothetical protein
MKGMTHILRTYGLKSRINRLPSMFQDAVNGTYITTFTSNCGTSFSKVLTPVPSNEFYSSRRINNEWIIRHIQHQVAAMDSDERNNQIIEAAVF